MKKFILLTLLPFSLLMAGPFIMTKEGSLIKANDVTTTNTSTTNTSTTNTSTTNTSTTIQNWTPIQLPTQAYNVLNYGLKGDGVTDDSAALRALAQNTSVTNWYFPQGYTFKLYGINVPSHVNAIYGGGTLKTIYKNETYPLGVFDLKTRPQTHLLIDGIEFIYTNTQYANGEYGAIKIDPHVTLGVQNVEIRNCSFTGNTSCPANGITIYGKKENGGTKHIYIHNNKFINIPRAGIEILHRSDNPTADGDGIEDINIFDNIFDFSASSGWKCAVSFSQVRQACLVENNTFNNTNWDIEINQAANITIRYNYSLNCNANFISMGSSGWHGNDIFTVAENWIYNNHFESETAAIHIYDGSKTKIYDNFINGTIWTQEQTSGFGCSAGEVYNNTIVKDATISVNAGQWTGPSDAIKLECQNSQSNIHNNTIYMKNSGHYGIRMLSSNTESQITDNNIYRNTNDSNCISTGGIKIGNTCIPNYGGAIPTTMNNAGLLQ